MWGYIIYNFGEWCCSFITLWFRCLCTTYKIAKPVCLLRWLQVAMNPDNTVFDAKRLIGRRFDDSSVQSDMKHWPFNIINDGGKPKIRVEYKGDSKTFFPEEISSMVLVKMKEIAEAYLGKVGILLLYQSVDHRWLFNTGCTGGVVAHG